MSPLKSPFAKGVSRGAAGSQSLTRRISMIEGGDMEQSPSRWRIIVKLLKFLFWTALVLLIAVQLWKPAQLDAARAEVVRRFQEQRKSRVIVLIHGEDTISFFGVPFGSFINMEDSESILRAIRLTPADQ